MLRTCASPTLAVCAALVAAIACGSDDERRTGAEGIADAYHEVAAHECRCLAAQAGSRGSGVEAICREQAGDAQEHFPVACIEDVIERHPEAAPAYDCAAEIAYDYAACVVDEGCTESDSEDDDDASTTCAAKLEAAVASCPTPPENVREEIEACFVRAPCEDEPAPAPAPADDAQCERAADDPGAVTNA